MGAFDMSNPNVHSIFIYILLLIKQFFEEKKKNHQGQHLKARHSFGLELSLEKKT